MISKKTNREQPNRTWVSSSIEDIFMALEDASRARRNKSSRLVCSREVDMVVAKVVIGWSTCSQIRGRLHLLKVSRS
jgi:hypothetical protein